MAITDTMIYTDEWSSWMSTARTTTSDIWRTWTNTTNTTTSTTSTTNAWYHWCEGTYEIRREVVRAQPRPETPAERAERQRRYQAQQEESRRRIEAEKKRREDAENRARELLLDNLSSAQRLDMEEFGFFFVESKKPNRKYRLRKGRSGNVDVIENDQLVHRLCAHPGEYVPDDDTRLSQKLMLEHMEDRFLGLANVHPARH